MNQDSSDNSDLTYRIIGLAMRVHRALGSRLLKGVYQRCLCHELSNAGRSFAAQVQMPIRYDGIEYELRRYMCQFVP